MLHTSNSHVPCRGPDPIFFFRCNVVYNTVWPVLCSLTICWELRGRKEGRMEERVSPSITSPTWQTRSEKKKNIIKNKTAQPTNNTTREGLSTHKKKTKANSKWEEDTKGLHGHMVLFVYWHNVQPSEQSQRERDIGKRTRERRNKVHWGSLSSLSLLSSLPFLPTPGLPSLPITQDREKPCTPAS